jgi:hypothetical protein
VSQQPKSHRRGTKLAARHPILKAIRMAKYEDFSTNHRAINYIVT